MHRRDFTKYGLASVSAAVSPLPACAYPERPIRLIVKPTLGTIAIENKGSGGAIGATEVARSKPHTFLFGNTSEVARWTPVVKQIGFTQ